MQLGRVCGQVVSTKKTDRLLGFKILVVQPVSLETFEDKGAPFVSLDGVGAGDGELVMCVSGSSSRQTGETDGKPVDNLIVAIIDSVDILGNRMFDKANPELKPALQPEKALKPEAKIEEPVVEQPKIIEEKIAVDSEKKTVGEVIAEEVIKEEPETETVKEPEEVKPESEKPKRTLRQKEEIEEASLVFKFSSKPRVENLDMDSSEDEKKDDAPKADDKTAEKADEPVITEIPKKTEVKETVLQHKKNEKSVSHNERKQNGNYSDAKRFDKKPVQSSEDNIDTNLDTIMKKWNEEKEAEAKKAERSSNKNTKPRH